MTGSPRNKYVQSGQGSSSQNFQPNGPYYRSFCCHVRKLTIVCGVIEIFLVCFLIVAVIPDLSSKICGNEEEIEENVTTTVSPSPLSTMSRVSTINLVTTRAPSVLNTTSGSPSSRRLKRQVYGNDLSISTPATRMVQTTTVPTPTSRTGGSGNDSLDDNSTNIDWSNFTGTPNPPLRILRFFTCNCNIMWLCLALIYILSANIMFYGLKSTKWYLFIPHISLRILCIIIILAFCTFLVLGFFFGQVTESMVTAIWILSVVGVFFCIPYGYVVFIEIKCAHFVKMSAETGFSLSNTRPVGPPTLSLSDSRQPQNNIQMQNLSNPVTAQELPPLRHTYGTGNVGN